MKKAIVFVFILAFIILPLKIFALEYGGGTYGLGDYNVGEVLTTPTPSASATASPSDIPTPSPSDIPTPSPSETSTPAPTNDSSTSGSNNNSNNGSSNSSGLSTPGCDNQIGSGSPDIFEIQTSYDTATLYFSPPQSPYSSFYIAYSTKNTSWEYGVEFNQSYSSGAIKYTINALKPNTLYYFQSRAGNGCATGTWGNVLTAKTTTSLASRKTAYKNFQTAITQTTKKLLARLLPSKIKTKNTTEVATVVPTSLPATPATPAPLTIATPIPESPAVSVVQPVKTRKPFCILWWCF